MKLEIYLHADNSAFEDPISELRGIFDRAMSQITLGESVFPLRDTNGNTVGLCKAYL